MRYHYEIVLKRWLVLIIGTLDLPRLNGHR